MRSVPSLLLRAHSTKAQRYVFAPGILEVTTNYLPLYGFVYGIAPGWGGGSELGDSVVRMEWRVTEDDRELQPTENAIVSYTGRRIPGGATARMVLRWDATHPVFLCNEAYVFWSALRGTSSHQLPGTILSDAATASLLANRLAPIHCSAVARDGRAIVLFAPSNTGKTTTSWNLVSRHGFSFVAEDIAITDGSRLHGAAYTGTGLPRPFPDERIPAPERFRRAFFPVWLKRSLARQLDPARVVPAADIGHIVFLERGPLATSDVAPDVAADLLLRNNRLEFRYLGSPHLIRSWYNGLGPDLDAIAAEERAALQRMVKSAARVVKISAPDPDEFAASVLKLL